AVDRILDEFFVPFATGQRPINLGDDPSFGIVAVGIDGADGADAAGGGPGAGAGVVGRRHALAALDQRPDLTPAVQDGLESLEQYPSPQRADAQSGPI